ncbi:hypothetical protein RJ640_005411 [Escallonia rubra]|uniref:Uncharacterized protein n=1 Tax=Escallonia rubra TaxID=112253 RepID=A0AA88ULG3_9ASTE|nr:hypothetical protein RJ640_005411 [Escallonia rubra]
MEEMDLRLVHPKMESSFFGNPNQRNSVGSGEYPETFFSMFAEMAKRVWLLHCLAFSFDLEAAIFQAQGLDLDWGSAGYELIQEE